MKLIYALPLAVVAAIAVSGCSKESLNSTSFTNHTALPSASSSAMPAPAASSEGTVPAPSSTTSKPTSGSTAQ